MFDFNRDGKDDAIDMAISCKITRSVEEEITISDEDERLKELGLDYDELMLMDDDERERLLRENDLDPDAFDF